MAYIPPTDWELRDFFREHADAVYRSCMLLTDGRADAQAMTKDIFLKLLNHGMEFSSSDDAKAWMILSGYKLRKKSMYLQKCAAPAAPETAELPLNIDEEETQDQAAEIIVVDPAEAQPEVTEDTAKEEPPAAQEGEETPEATVESEEKTSEELQQPVDQQPQTEETPVAEITSDSEPEKACYPAEILKLSSKDRLIALLYYCEGYRKSEIASYLGCTTFMIRSRLSRLKKRLPGDNGSMIRRNMRDVYNLGSPTQEQKEALLEALLAERLRDTERHGKKWHRKGQGFSWLVILVVLAVILGAAYYGADQMGWVAIAKDGLSNAAVYLEDKLTPETEEPSVPETTLPHEQSADRVHQIYSGVIDRYLLAFDEKWDPGRCAEENISILVGFLEKPQQLSFALMDLDADGLDELLITDGNVIYDLYTCEDGKAVHVLSGAERNSFSLTTDNMLINVGSGGASNTIYTFYRYIHGNLVVDQMVVFDANRDPVSAWFRGFDLEHLQPITEIGARDIIDSYKKMSIICTPITSFE